MPDQDCWNRIGVRGDGSCAELTAHGHCHSCPSYASVALALLDRDVPNDYTDATTAHFAAPPPSAERAMQSVVVFRAGREWLALSTSVVAEIAHTRQIHSLPHRRGHILGVVNVHGELQVCASLAQMLGVSPPSTEASAGSAHRARLLMVHRESIRAACPVDEVAGIGPVPVDQMQDVPATLARSASPFTKKVFTWGDRVVGLIDDEVLFVALKRSFA